MDAPAHDGDESEADPWEMALQGLDLVVLNPHECRLWLDDARRLKAEIHGRSYPDVVAYMPYPLTLGDSWVSLVSVSDPDGDGRRSDGRQNDRVEIGVLPGLGGLDGRSREAVAEALRLRYFLPRVTRILRVSDEDPGQSGAVNWELDTDRGVMRLRMPNLFEGIQELAPGRLILSDYDGNRAEIPNVADLDRDSQRQISRYYWY